MKSTNKLNALPAGIRGGDQFLQRGCQTVLAITLLGLAGCNAGNSSQDTIPPTGNTAENPSIDLPVIVRTPRVVNGSAVNHDNYPWMVALLNGNANNASNGQFCGGSVIAKRWVLTAAHCVESETAGRVTTLTGRKVLSKSGGEAIGVSRIIIHPDYADAGYPDIALLELKRDSSAPVLPMPSLNYLAPSVNEPATVIGWGSTSENGSSTNKLLETALTIADHQSCATAYARSGHEIVKDAMVCAGNNAGNDSCYGDSGGPLFVKRGEQFVQAGIVSFGEQCGLPSHPGVYTRVATYYDWVAGYADVTAYTGDNVDPITPIKPDTPIEEPDTPNSEPDNPSEESDNAITANCDNLTCSFTATTGQLDYFWDFGDGYYDFGQAVEHEYFDAGDYSVYLGTVDQNGDYQEAERLVSVGKTNDSDNGGDIQLNYNGTLRGRGAQHDLPRNEESISLPAGNLTLTLDVPAGKRFRVFVDRYDTGDGYWYEEARTTSRKGSAKLRLAIEAGEYGFTVLSLSKGGKYELDISLQP